MLKLLKNKNILMLWGSRAFSRFGDALETLALLYLVYDLTGSGLAMGSLMLFSTLPNAIVSPFAGVIADKYNKKKIMFWAEMSRTLCILLIPILMYTKLITLWHIYVLSILISIAESFFEPTAGITFVLVVGKDDIPLFNSLGTTTNHIMRIVGYSLSGILMTTIGKEPIFIIDALTFLVSAIISLIVIIPNINKTEEKQSKKFSYEFKNGFSYILKNKIIVVILFIILLMEFLMTPLQTYIPLIIDKILKISNIWSGYFSTALIVGAILGNIIYPLLLKTKFKLHHLYLTSLLILGTILVLSSFIINPFYYLFMYFIVGLLSSLISVWSFTEIQMLVDINYLGRVGSIITMICLMSSPLSGVLFGGLADKIYIPTIFRSLAYGCLILSFISYILSKATYKSYPTTQSLCEEQ